MSAHKLLATREPVRRLERLAEMVAEECDPEDGVCHGHDLTDDGDCALLADLESIHHELCAALGRAESAFDRLMANLESLSDEQWMNPVNYTGPVADLLRTLQRRLLLILKDAATYAKGDE